MNRNQFQKDLVRGSQALDQAYITSQMANRDQTVQRVPLDLSVARDQSNPFQVNFPFKSFYVETATDVLTNIYVRPTTRDEVQSYFKCKVNDSWANDHVIPTAFIHWSAQPGKSIELIFFTNAEFRSGSQISVTGGGVSIVDGSSLTGPTRVVLGAATSGIIAPALSTRKKATIQNKTAADLYIGDSTVTNTGTTEGIKIPPDGIIYWQNTGALYGYSLAGGNVHRLEES